MQDIAEELDDTRTERTLDGSTNRLKSVCEQLRKKQEVRQRLYAQHRALNVI